MGLLRSAVVGSGSFKRLQGRCQLALQSSEGLCELEDSTSKLITWLLQEHSLPQHMGLSIGLEAGFPELMIWERYQDGCGIVTWFQKWHTVTSTQALVQCKRSPPNAIDISDISRSLSLRDTWELIITSSIFNFTTYQMFFIIITVYFLRLKLG